MKEKKWLTIPNLLSVFRILLIPAFVGSYLRLENTDMLALWPLVILAASGITDLFDGMIARAFHQVSDIGKVLDPIADKLTQITVLACLAFRFWDVWMLWALLGVYVVKEICMLIGGVLLLKAPNPEVPQAKWFGKVATFEFYTAMLLLLAFPNLSDSVITMLAFVTAVLAVFSLVMYIIRFFEKKKQANASSNRKEENA